MIIDNPKNKSKKETKIEDKDLGTIKKEEDGNKILVTKNNINNEENKNEIEEENYIKINTKNQFDIYNPIESSKKLKEIISYVDDFLEEDSKSQSVTQIFLGKLFPKCLNKAFNISKSISKMLMKTKKINRKIIGQKIRNFFDKRMELRYSKKIVLNKENINDLGYILSYSYMKFDDLKISGNEELHNKIKSCKKIDTINDFYTYCNKKNKNPIDNNLLDFLESKNDEYLIPGEFLFLINIFDCINILEIDMNLEIDESNEKHNDNFYLFIITHLNINYLVLSINHFKVNFNNIKFQKEIYSYFTEELNSAYKNSGRYLKKNKEISENEKYLKKWDFEKDYIVKNKKKNFNIIEEGQIMIKENNNDKIDNNKKLKEVNKFGFVEIDKIQEFSNSKISPIFNRRGSFKKKSLNSSFLLKTSTKYGTEIDNSLNMNNTFKETSEKRKSKDKYDKMVDNNRNLLELIYFVCLGILRLKNLNNVDLIIHDCYYKEFINLFEQYYFSHKITKSTIYSFHILNNFIKKMQKAQRFNIDFNCLDYYSFNKVLSILKKNEQLKSLQMSFFSSSIIYSLQFIYKIYLQSEEKKEIKKKDIYNLESFLLYELLPYFIENLEALFELIKLKMESFEILSFNFDTPEIIGTKPRYLIVILKFILNILLLVDNKKSKIKKLVIVSPKTILDIHSILNIEEILNTIDIDKKNKNIKELSIQMRFYRISNIKNIISNNLIDLKLGEMDIFTLEKLSKYLCSFNFFKKSLLKSLTIGILNSITNFTKEIEYILNELFSIKIKTLKEINIYSNIFIKNKSNFFQILENNWISSCILTLNEKSILSWKQKELEESINQKEDDNQNNIKINKSKDIKILYLLHHELEKDILTPNEIAKKNKKKLENINCEVAWYLKYILIFQYSKKKKFKINYYEVKNIIFNILKFLYFTKTAKIQNEIQ